MASLAFAVTWSTVATAGKYVHSASSWLSKARNAPTEVLMLRDALRMIEQPLAICSDLGTREIMCSLMSPAVELAKEVMAGCSELRIDNGREETPSGAEGWKTWMSRKVGIEPRHQYIDTLIKRLQFAMAALQLALATAQSRLGHGVWTSRMLPWDPIAAHAEATATFKDTIAVPGRAPRGLKRAVTAAVVYGPSSSRGSNTLEEKGGGICEDSGAHRPWLIYFCSSCEHGGFQRDCVHCNSGSAEEDGGGRAAAAAAAAANEDTPPTFRLELVPSSKDHAFKGSDAAGGAAGGGGGGGDEGHDASVQKQITIPLPAGTIFKQRWRGEMQSTIESSTAAERNQCAFSLNLPTNEKWVLLPECAKIEDEEEGEWRALSAEQFASFVALALYTNLHSPTALGGDDDHTSIGSPQSADLPEMLKLFRCIHLDYSDSGSGGDGDGGGGSGSGGSDNSTAPHFVGGSPLTRVGSSPRTPVSTRGSHAGGGHL